MNRLPYDCCRCTGNDCERKESCLRYVALNDMGHKTPVADNYCGAPEFNGYIKIED